MPRRIIIFYGSMCDAINGSSILYTRTRRTPPPGDPGVLFKTLWRPAARRARSGVGPLAPTGAAVPGGLSIGPLPWLGISTSNGGTPAVGARQLAFALRCAEKRPHCRRGPPRWRPGRWVRQAGLRAARSSPGTSRRRYPAARDPAVLRGHRPVARATGGKGPRVESRACRAGRGTSIGSAHNVRAGRVCGRVCGGGGVCGRWLDPPDGAYSLCG